ncbi:MAG: serine protease [Proteobacteria bacterium]|nr:serine protease [Pseudomonadota bacterium]
MTLSAPDALAVLSDAIAGRVAAAAPLLVALRGNKGRTLSAIAWRPDLIVTSEQTLPSHDTHAAVLPGGEEIAATLAGRDPGTNVAILRPAKPLATPGVTPAAAPRPGALALLVGAGPTAQLGVVQEVGPAWHSMAGGRIDLLLRLDLRAGRGGEGGLVLDAAGNAFGMAAAGPRGQMLVIPTATIEASLGPLAAEGRVARGWLGVGLQPVTIPAGLREAAGQDQGRMIVGIEPGGPAEQAGLLPGDIVLTLDGCALGDLRALRACLGPDSIGRSIEVRLLRGGATETRALVVGAQPKG